MNEFPCGLCGMILTGDNWSTVTKTCPIATFSTTNSEMHEDFAFNLIFVVPCIMLNSEINPTRCNNCVYSSQWLYSTCFGWQFHPSAETCRVKPLRRINAIVASCWTLLFFTRLFLKLSFIYLTIRNIRNRNTLRFLVTVFPWLILLLGLWGRYIK